MEQASSDVISVPRQQFAPGELFDLRASFSGTKRGVPSCDGWPQTSIGSSHLKQPQPGTSADFLTRKEKMSDYQGQHQVVYVGLAVIFAAGVIWFSIGNDTALKAEPSAPTPAVQTGPSGLNVPWADMG